MPITGTADPVVGAPACKSGNTTGFTCGKITAVDQWSYRPDLSVDNAFIATACTLPGDSGGAIATGTKALGISHGTANIPNGECGHSTTVWGQPIKSVLAANPGRGDGMAVNHTAIWIRSSFVADVRGYVLGRSICAWHGPALITQVAIAAPGLPPTTRRSGRSPAAELSP
ncbi:S1 family peptidase [Rhodococcus sp. NPDC055112]